MKDKYKIVELFSGIGSQAKALTNIGINIDVQATCEWDVHASMAYDAIHKSTDNVDGIDELSKKELIEILSKYSLSSDGKKPMTFNALKSYDVVALRRIYSSIIRTRNLIDISKIKGAELPLGTDIMTYSFPCQDLSNVGAFHGYNKGIDPNSGSRSSLLWQVGRILSEMKDSGHRLPRYLIMENVPTLLSNRHRPNFELWKQQLEKLGYISKEYQLNAKDFGIPQNRPRLLMMSVFVGTDLKRKKRIEEYFEKTESSDIINKYRKSEYYKNVTIKELLRIPKSTQSILWREAVACTPNDTESRRKIWDENPKIIDENGKLTKESFIRTITTKQDRNPNSGNIYFDTGIQGLGKFRYLTPRECMLFMGFTDEDYERIIKNNPVQRCHSLLFPRDKIIRMAGNSIPVKLLEGFFYQLYSLEDLY